MLTDKNALIIFQKNKVKGKVKTRLAATVGEENALNVFKFLVDHTYAISFDTNAKKFLFFSDFIETSNATTSDFMRMIQQGSGLGERMSNAFQYVFNAGFTKVIIIGTDCYEINASIINEAFDLLNTNKFVIGPAVDGGYYLLGMTKNTPNIFENKHWSTDTVYEDTLTDFKNSGATYTKLVVLSDIDTEADLRELKNLLAVHLIPG
ncbi:MAG: TIGR04282 family arsenosugar biosynthesis glycosyltransferase [Bacteroidia bacterium]|nr:TIGR04282 family arsenosugar biosynthesis glycosyltransferase [Bacteroidia bacterium]